MVIANKGYAAHSASAPLELWDYEIRDPQDGEVIVEVKYCGICHSDIHVYRNDFGSTNYPLVPGHEFVGLVSSVGPKVTKFKVGDKVGVGCRVGSCLDCRACKTDQENYCLEGVGTYNGKDHTGAVTKGGYGKYVVCPEHFCLSIPDTLPFEKVAPLLCAGITTYLPIVEHGINKGGYKVAVVGLGGLGHMAVQFAAAFGNEVTVISRTRRKEELAKQLGAKGILPTDEPETIKAAQDSFDYILDTVSDQRDANALLSLLQFKGKLICLGAQPAGTLMSVSPLVLLIKGKTITGSLIGGVKPTQEMINFCAERSILPYTELIPASYINQAYERVIKGDVMFRFVIDVGQTIQ